MDLRASLILVSITGRKWGDLEANKGQEGDKGRESSNLLRANTGHKRG